MTKVFIHPSILNIFTHFSESNGHVVPGFLCVNMHKKEYKTIFRTKG